MIVEPHTYYAICAVIFLAGTVPLMHLVRSGRVDKWWYMIVFFFLFVVFIQLTPMVYTVEDCGLYKKGFLLLPKDDLKPGENSYVVNQSQKTLFITSVGYGEVDYKLSLLGEEDVYLQPGEFIRLPFVQLDFVFETPPERLQVEGKGAIRYHLSCSHPDSDIEEEEMETEMDNAEEAVPEQE